MRNTRDPPLIPLRFFGMFQSEGAVTIDIVYLKLIK